MQRLNTVLVEVDNLCRAVEEASRRIGRARAAKSEGIQSKLNDCLAKLLDLCEADGLTHGMIEPVFQRSYELTYEGLVSLDLRLVPLAVMRELLCRHQLVVLRTQCPNWSRFSERYQAAIHA